MTIFENNLWFRVLVISEHCLLSLVLLCLILGSAVLAKINLAVLNPSKLIKLS